MPLLQTRLRAAVTAAALSALLLAGAAPAVASPQVPTSAASVVLPSTLASATVVKPRVSANPRSSSVVWGTTATFSVKASGSGLRYQWYYAKPGSSWKALSGASARKATLRFVAKPSFSGYSYLAKVVNSGGAVNSRSAKVTVSKPVTIHRIASRATTSSATIKPSVSTTGRTHVVSTVITVKHGSSTVANRVHSAKLRPGTYTVWTKTSYKTFSPTTKRWSGTYVKYLKQSLVIKRSSHYVPSGRSCPSSYPIKGNRSTHGDWIYHVPGGRWYSVTVPEDCFATTSNARAAGYRASKNG